MCNQTATTHPLPIPQSVIDEWKQDAKNGGTLAGYSVGNNTTVSIGPKKDVIGYGITIGNNSSVTYDANLSNSSFSSGPGGSWRVTKWREIP